MGELLCDTDPVNTNHYWVPPMRKLVCAVMVRFPLGGHEGEENDNNDEDDSSSANDNIIVDGDVDVEDIFWGWRIRRRQSSGTITLWKSIP